jgi:rubrerythrin
MATVSALKTQLDAAVKSSASEVKALHKKIDDTKSELLASITDCIKNVLAGQLSGQTEALQAAMQQTERNIQQAMDGFKTECRNMITKVSEDFQVVKHDVDQVKVVSAEALRKVNKIVATAAQPHPSMLREIKERITNDPNLIISPVSDDILDSNLRLHIVQICNSHTDLSLSVADVVAVKRLGREGSQFRGVRVMFTNANVRNKVFNEKRKFGKQRGDLPAVFLNPDLTRSQQEHKRRMLPLFKNIRDTNRQAGVQGKAPFFDEELLYHFPNPQARMGYPVLHPANYEDHAAAAALPAAAMPAAMPAVPSTSAAAAP